MGEHLKFEFYINYIDKSQISENKNELNWFKISRLGATLLPDDSTNIGKKNMTQKVNIPEKNWKGNFDKNLFVFLDSGRNFNFFFVNSIFTCLTLNMPRQIKTFNTTK